MTRDLTTLVAQAAAARVRFNEYAARADLDEDRFRELEQADHDARRAVCKRLAEMHVNAEALRAVLS